jgi:hypothetical protein
MTWNGNECGKIEGNLDIRTTNPNTEYDRSKTI